MEFNFRSINHRSSSSTYFSSSPNPALNPNYVDNYTHYSLRSSSSSSSSSYFTSFPVPPPFPAGFDALDMRQRDIMQREMEKERIRAEILAEEIMRRRELEEEVRREIMIERDRILRYGSPRIDSRVPLLTNFEEIDRFRSGVSTWSDTRFGGLEPLPFQRGPGVERIGNGSSSGVTLKEIKRTDEANKEKVIILAKPNLYSTDLKRKTTPAGGGDVEVKPVSVKKQKTEDEWSCALCQVTVNNERGMNEHLKGKKHLARERGLVTQKVGFGVSPKPKVPEKTTDTPKPKVPKKITDTPKSKVPKKTTKTPKSKVPKKTTVNSSQKTKVNEGGKSSTKVSENSTQKTSGTEKSMLDEQNSVEKSTKPKKSPSLWCEICKVEVHTQKVMDEHVRGKKHLANFRKLNQLSSHVREKQSADPIAEENKKRDFPNVVIKQETVAKAEIKVGSGMPQTENEHKIIDNVTDDGITKKDNEQELPSAMAANC